MRGLSWALGFASFTLLSLGTGVSATEKWPPAPVERSGQTDCYNEAGAPISCDGTGQDADLLMGEPHPVPRFTINGDGTVTDNLTGLIWLRETNCSGPMDWEEALSWSNGLYDGCPDCGGTDNDCGLSDGSQPGDWRLPNSKELQSLLHCDYYDPALPNTVGDGQWSEGDAFFSVFQSRDYFSSSTLSDHTDYAHILNLYLSFQYSPKNEEHHAWAVRNASPPEVRWRPAPVEKTGQLTCYDMNGAVIGCVGTGQDGEYRSGIDLPQPRFTINGNGTVTDNLTNLVWLRHGNCSGFHAWDDRLEWVSHLYDGCPDCGGENSDCGLGDGSQAGDWRLPNLKEVATLRNLEYGGGGNQSPALSNATGDGPWADGDPFLFGDEDFTSRISSSTTYPDSPYYNHVVSFDSGVVAIADKWASQYAWAVRGDSRAHFADGFESGNTSAWSGTEP